MIFRRPDKRGYSVIAKEGDKYFYIPKVIRMECEAMQDERGVVGEACTEELWEQYKRQKELEGPKLNESE